MNECPKCGLITGVHNSTLPGCMCFLTPQRKWQELTDDERVLCEQLAKGNYVTLCAAIEAKLKEKNNG
jgi:hypothetical protein